MSDLVVNTATFLMIVLIAWLIGIGREWLAVFRLRKPKAQPKLTRVIVPMKHVDGRNCPKFYVDVCNDYPIMWCPYCGVQTRQELSEVESVE